MQRSCQLCDSLEVLLVRRAAILMFILEEKRSNLVLDIAL